MAKKRAKKKVARKAVRDPFGAVQCAKCKRVIYRKDADEGGRCSVCRPPRTVKEVHAMLEKLEVRVEALAVQLQNASRVSPPPVVRTPSASDIIEEFVRRLRND